MILTFGFGLLIIKLIPFSFWLIKVPPIFLAEGYPSFFNHFLAQTPPRKIYQPSASERHLSTIPTVAATGCQESLPEHMMPCKSYGVLYSKSRMKSLLGANH